MSTFHWKVEIIANGVAGISLQIYCKSVKGQSKLIECMAFLDFHYSFKFNHGYDDYINSEEVTGKLKNKTNKTKQQEQQLTARCIQ